MNELSRGNGPPTLLSPLEEQTMMLYIKMMADHNEPFTTLEFMDYASGLLFHLYPEKTKSIIINSRICNTESGHREIVFLGIIEK